MLVLVQVVIVTAGMLASPTSCLYLLEALRRLSLSLYGLKLLVYAALSY
jgi:hypothetical protein